MLEVAASMVVGYVMITGVKRICRYTDRRQVPGKLSPASLTQELLYIIAFAVVVENGLLLPFTALSDDGLSWNDLATINTVPMLYTLIYYGIVRSRTYLKAYIQYQLLVEKLTNDHLQTELKFLRAQYHPHFLFNALNTIYFQVDEDVPGAKQSKALSCYQSCCVINCMTGSIGWRSDRNWITSKIISCCKRYGSAKSWC
jgi:hypothetical protein